MKILITNNQKKIRVPKKNIEKKCKKILEYMSFENAELSILITCDKEIKGLNNQYRKKNKSTNVLSFAQNAHFKKKQPRLLGDLVISIETVKKEAIKNKISTNKRLSQLLTHGILHLIGYNHSIEMDEKSIEILDIIETFE